MQNRTNKRGGRKPTAKSVAGGPLGHAAIALGEVLTFEHPSDAVLSAYFRRNRMLGHHDRGVVAESVYGVLRRLRSVRAIAGQEATPRELVLAWLVRCEGWSVRRFEGI